MPGSSESTIVPVRLSDEQRSPSPRQGNGAQINEQNSVHNSQSQDSPYPAPILRATQSRPECPLSRVKLDDAQ